MKTLFQHRLRNLKKFNRKIFLMRILWQQYQYIYPVRKPAKEPVRVLVRVLVRVPVKEPVKEPVKVLVKVLVKEQVTAVPSA